MANNFTLEFDGQYQIVTSGDAIAFCSGTGSVTIQGVDGRSAGMMLKSSVWGDVASVSWNETSGSNSSNVGYYDTNMNWYSLSPTYSWSGSKLTITNLNLPSDAYWVWFANSTNGSCTYSNLEILDANGNSLLESSEPSTGLPLYIGDSNIQAVKLGDVDISKMYIGNTLIYGT